MRPGKSQTAIQPDYRPADRRDAPKLAGLERLWEIFRAEAIPGRAGTYYALNRTDPIYGGHVDGGPIDHAMRRADLPQLLGDAAMAVFRPKKYAEMARNRDMELYGTRSGEPGDGNPELADKVTVGGRYPATLGTLDPVSAGGDLRRRMAQAAGVATRDVMTQAPQSLYWLMNASEALASLASQGVQRGALGASKGVKIPFTNKRIGAQDAVSPANLPQDTYKMPGAAVYSTIPLIGLTGLASGTLLRAPGYKAVFPETSLSDGEEYDTSESQNPLAEGVMRVLGWKGNLQAYGDFAQERPDVTKEEFMKYSAYLQGRSPVKATAEGIHGPEVNLFGKSLPLLTGVIPIAAGLLGARQGLRMAGNRLAGRGWRGLEAPGTIPTTVTIAGQRQQVPDRFKQAENAYVSARRSEDDPDSEPGEASELRTKARRIQSEIDRDKLIGVLTGSSLLGGTAAVATQGLEAFRQANNWEENRNQVAADLAEALKEKSQDRERIRLDGLAGLIP